MAADIGSGGGDSGGDGGCDSIGAGGIAVIRSAADPGASVEEVAAEAREALEGVQLRAARQERGEFPLTHPRVTSEESEQESSASGTRSPPAAAAAAAASSPPAAPAAAAASSPQLDPGNLTAAVGAFLDGWWARMQALGLEAELHGMGLHSSTLRLNLSAFCGIGVQMWVV